MASRRLLLLVSLVCLVSFRVALCAPFSALDAYSPACSLPTDYSTQGWSLWSKSTTWNSAVIPGVNATWVDVDIPCGTKVIIDVPLLQIRALNIKGWVRVLDSPSLPKVEVQAMYIIVQGYLGAGTSTSSFSQSLTFTLMPNTKESRAEYLYTERAPADAANPRSLGHKIFAVVGGQLDLHGMPGSASTPSWTRITQPATAGSKYLIVGTDVSAWPVGDSIAISSTDLDLNQAETLTIAKVAAIGGNQWNITVTSKLAYFHEGSGYIFAEVALLDRQIVIQGLDEASPNQYDGGHMQVFMTPTPQLIEGVQFTKLGFAGNIGHYPLHFHICGDSKGQWVVRKNAMVWTKQRCMIVHATSNLLIQENIAYETRGHCYITEEGSEFGNTFLKNLGMNTRKPYVQIASTFPGKQTDITPSTFWMAGAANNYIGNVAAGSEDSGFWIEMLTAMRGFSKTFPGIGNKSPQYFGFGTYDGNVAHSSMIGFRTYPHGSYDMETQEARPSMPQAYLTNHLMYRTAMGMFLHQTRMMTVKNSVFVDNWLGMHIKVNMGFEVTGCTFIGRLPSCSSRLKSASAITPRTLSLLKSDNAALFSALDLTMEYGEDVTPFHTNLVAAAVLAEAVISRAGNTLLDKLLNGEHRFFKNGLVERVADMQVKTVRGMQVSASASYKKQIEIAIGKTWLATATTPVGIAISQVSPRDVNANINITGTSFSQYSSCFSQSPGVLLYTRPYGGIWNPSLTVRGLNFDSGMNRLWADPTPSGSTYNVGNTVSNYYTMRDLDGSFIGSAGYVVANNKQILPPNPITSCKVNDNWGSVYTCPNQCYRLLNVWFSEPSPSNMVNHQTSDSDNNKLPYTSLQYKRVSDGNTITYIGSDNQYSNQFAVVIPSVATRALSAPLIGGQTYHLTFVPPPWNPTFYPSSVTLDMNDGGGCNTGFTVVLLPPNKTMMWQVATNNPKGVCSGKASSPSKTYQRTLCISTRPALAVDIGGSQYDNVLTAVLVKRPTRKVPLTKKRVVVACKAAPLCGVKKKSSSSSASSHLRFSWQSFHST